MLVSPNKLWYHIICQCIYVNVDDSGHWIVFVVCFRVWDILKHDVTFNNPSGAISSVPVLAPQHTSILSVFQVRDFERSVHEGTGILGHGVSRGGEGFEGSKVVTSRLQGSGARDDHLRHARALEEERLHQPRIVLH